MATVTTQFKGFIKLDVHNFIKSGVQLQVKHVKGWRTLFEFTAEDMIKFINKSKKRKLK